MLYLVDRMGSCVDEITIDLVKEHLIELYNSNDEEHISITLSNDYEKGLEIYRKRVILFHHSNKKETTLFNIEVMQDKVITNLMDIMEYLDKDNIKDLEILLSN